MQENWFSKGLTETGVWLARPSAFLVVLAYVVIWLLTDPKSFSWHEVLAVVTLCVALFIQRSEHRDTQAVHAKLDELLRSVEGAQSELAKLDEEEPEKIERIRERHGAAEEARKR